jgi:YHS domain-containing protein
MTDHSAATGTSHHHHDHDHDHDPVKPGVDTAECPVMPGRFVAKAKAEARGWVRHYAGRTYWLCCAGCVPKFDTDPAKFAVA